MDVLAQVGATGLIAPQREVVVLLSGGRDSVCLLDVCVAIAGAVHVRALHVDYGLRPESGADAEFCAQLCDGFGVELVLERAGEPEGNVQAWARDVRYGAGAKLAIARGALLAAGHTASDQAETILYRLASSPGRRALLGMPEKAGPLVRPLLGVTRADTEAHCRARGLAWRDDPSNDGDLFARTRIRHGLLPALEQVDARAAANVVRTAELLREEADVLDTVVDTALQGCAEIAVEELAAIPRALARLIVRRLAEDATGELCPRAAGRLPQILGLSAGALDVGDGARAVVADGILRFERTPPLPPRSTLAG